MYVAGLSITIPTTSFVKQESVTIILEYAAKYFCGGALVTAQDTGTSLVLD